MKKLLLITMSCTILFAKEDTNLSLYQKDKINQSFSKMKKEFYQKQIDKIQDKDTDSSIAQIAKKDFELYSYEKNYLMPATYSLNEENDSREQFETQFQISIEKPISYNFLGLGETISAAYTQKSMWQTAKHSSPFRETNYKPEIFVTFPYEKSSRLKAYKFGLVHESNGRAQENSRSWNRIYVQTFFQLSNLFIVPKIWYRIQEREKNDDNPDIYNYYGYGDLTLFYAHKKHTFELKLRDNLKFNSKNKGSIDFTWNFPLPELLSTKNSYGMLNIFSGYGHSLIDYDKEINRIGFGIAFSR